MMSPRFALLVALLALVLAGCVGPGVPADGTNVNTSCTPMCDGRACGGDGCGGSCGDCAGGLGCNSVGQCEMCNDDCSGRECGTNSCGQSCGTCTSGSVCRDDMCMVSSTAGIRDNRVIRQNRPAPLIVGNRITTPEYGTILRRVSNASEAMVDGRRAGFETQVYSQLQAFSSDGQFVLLDSDGTPFFRVRRMSDLSIVEGIDLDGVNTPRWHRTRPHVLLHFDTNADRDVELQFTDLDTEMTETVATLDGYAVICPNESFDETSHDGKWLAGVARRADESDQFGCRDAADFNDIFSYNIEEKRYGARINIKQLWDGPCREGDRPDWTAPSPLGDYLMVQWVASGTDRCNGLETFDIETGAFIGRVTDHPTHGDIGLVEGWQTQPAGRRQFFMTYEFNTGPDNFEFEEIVAYSWLPGPATGRADINRLLPLASGLPDHISCQGPDGACLMTTGPSNTGATPFEAEIGIVHLDGTFVRLTQHHSTECGYFSQPRATWSRDGRFAIFASDWGNDRCDGGDYAGGRPDPYIIELF